jgi:hypothetical protein
MSLSRKGFLFLVHGQKTDTDGGCYATCPDG